MKHKWLILKSGMKNTEKYKGKHYKKIYKESWYKIIKQSIYLSIYPYIMKCVNWIDRFDNWYDNIDFKRFVDKYA
jgi:hypothetical protein